MASRTQILCLHEGTRNRSIDPVFILTLLKKLDPAWLRPWQGSNIVRTQSCGGRKELIAAVPAELRRCVAAGGNTTLMVWADVDHDFPDCEALKEHIWRAAKQDGVAREHFDSIVFIFAKDRLENWIEFLNSGSTEESREGPRVKHSRHAVDAAGALAQHCSSGRTVAGMPESLQWSCRNWNALKARMR